MISEGGSRKYFQLDNYIEKYKIYPIPYTISKNIF